MAKPPGTRKASAKPKPRVISSGDHELFLGAVASGRLEKVTQLLARGYDPSHDKSYCLRVALSGGFPRIADLLVQRGARVSDMAAGFLRNALDSGRPMEWQIDFVLARVDRAVLTADVLIATVGHPKALRALLKAGADPNGWAAEREGGEMLTPLISAVQRGQVESAIALLDAGADPNCLVAQHGGIDSSGRVVAAPSKPILLVTMESAQQPVVKRLIEAGADVNALYGNEPLLCRALVWNAEESAAWLIRAGADPDAGDAPTLVIMHALWGIVPHLLRAGARFPSPLPPTRFRLIPLCVLGLLLRAGSDLADADLVRLTQTEAPPNTPCDTVRALAVAKAALVYPDLLPQKLL